jgi:anti-anti-sigma regulatory factor
MRLEAVWVNGNRYADFDPDALTVRLPAVPSQRQPSSATAWAAAGQEARSGVSLSVSLPQSLDVRVVVAPASLPYRIESQLTSGTAQLTLSGDLDDSAGIALRLEFRGISAARPKEVILRLSGLRSMSQRCARALAFAKQDLDVTTTMTVAGASQEVKHALADAGVLGQCTILDAGPAEAGAGSATR